MNHEQDDAVDVDAWVDAYIRAYSRSVDANPGLDDPDWWAVERSMDLILKKDVGEQMWCFILGVLAKRPHPKVLAVLAAGPLEDLIAHQGKFFIDRIELAARQDPAFRDLLGGVWQNQAPADLWRRIEMARGATW